jgi:hypothetical protein
MAKKKKRKGLRRRIEKIVDRALRRDKAKKK